MAADQDQDPPAAPEPGADPGEMTPPPRDWPVTPAQQEQDDADEVPTP